MNAHEQKVYDTLKSVGATSPEKAKKVDDIAKMVAPLGKGQVASAVASLKAAGLLDIGHESRTHAYYVKK